jgi:hypothetical protein
MSMGGWCMKNEGENLSWWQVDPGGTYNVGQAALRCRFWADYPAVASRSELSGGTGKRPVGCGARAISEQRVSEAQFFHELALSKGAVLSRIAERASFEKTLFLRGAL